MTTILLSTHLHRLELKENSKLSRMFQYYASSWGECIHGSNHGNLISRTTATFIGATFRSDSSWLFERTFHSDYSWQFERTSVCAAFQADSSRLFERTIYSYIRWRFERTSVCATFQSDSRWQFERERNWIRIWSVKTLVIGNFSTKNYHQKTRRTKCSVEGEFKKKLKYSEVLTLLINENILI